ncbi:SymE family type I addiction module toxin [Caballeronia novacaledonica]|uniref:SymE family type I addiction module toxin n=1 Tax=Caballeronia novacaledonica TaxID=1544861 RepID=UPI001FEA0B89|nr:SymE family type I addiction module toxin [Caballeronia novacaledonica]
MSGNAASLLRFTIFAYSLSKLRKARSTDAERFKPCEATVRESDFTKKHGPYEPPLPAPRIRLVGRWPEQAGFKPQSRVRVQVEDRKLTITPA